MYHVGGSVGCLPVPTTLGCIMVIPEFYSPQRVLELIERERCVARAGMSTMYVREMQLPDFRDYDLSSLRAGWTIGPPALLDTIRAEFPIEGMVQLYGSSEGGSTAGDVNDPWEVRRVSAGRPLPGTEFSIVDPETGEDLPVGQSGEVRFKGWARCLGYVGFAREDTFDSKGRFITGDLGHFDADGQLYFDGRLKEMIKPGGENVSALEVEAFLGAHPDIAQVAVFGVPDDELGEAVMAVIERVEGSSLSAADIRAFCQGRIARFRIPRHIRFISDWPMTGSGKILKRVLREQCVVELEGGLV
jgi:fatty-acyl-CoA synthase/long-chain acyl-CoA synthetase